jgi:hypothetical protein
MAVYQDTTKERPHVTVDRATLATCRWSCTAQLYPPPSKPIVAPDRGGVRTKKYLPCAPVSVATLMKIKASGQILGLLWPPATGPRKC